MNGAIIGVFLVIIAYLVMMLAIGFFYSKGNNDSSDFYLGGRKLGPFVTAMSAEAALFACLEPLTAATLSVVWLHASFTAADLIGFACILATVVLMR